MKPIQVFQALLAAFLGTYVVAPNIFTAQAIGSVREGAALGVMVCAILIVMLAIEEVVLVARRSRRY